MILTCPSCATSYFAPDDAIGPGGRTVRCKACSHTWKASAEEPLELNMLPPSAAKAVESETPIRREPTTETLAETPAPELPRAFRARAEQQRRLRRAATHGVIWAGIASGFAVLLGAAWLFRVDVVEMAPRAASAYAAVGMEVNATGLEFESITARPSPNDPGVVVVSGALRNVRDDERVAPAIRVALLDARGAEIGHRLVHIDAAPVLPGKVQGFATLIPDPGAKGAGVGVDFALDATRSKSRPRDAVPAHDAPTPVPAPVPAPVHVTQPVAAHGAPATSLRPAIASDVSATMRMQPVDARPLPLDIAAAEPVSAGHG